EVLEPQPPDRRLDRARPVLYHYTPVRLFARRVAVDCRAQNAECLVARCAVDQVISRAPVYDAVDACSAVHYLNVVLQSSIRTEIEQCRNEHIFDIDRIELDDTKA